MKKLLLGGTVAAALFAGASLGPAIASADNDADTTNNSESNYRHGQGQYKGQRGSKMGGRLANSLGIDKEALMEGRQAGQTLAETLAANGISADDAKATILAQMESHLAEAVEQGRLTQAEADEKLASAPERIEEMINRTPGEHGNSKRKMRGHKAEVLDELGISSDDVKAGFAEGKTLAEIAEEAGVSEEDLIAKLVAQTMEKVDAAIEAGKLTQDEADDRLAELEDRVTERVNETPGARGDRGGRGHRR